MADENGTGLPASIEAAWGLRPRRTRGRRQELSLERIVEAAVSLADTDGLAAVSMARVARALGSSTMALYRHVASKDELLVLMVDAGYGPAPDRITPAEGWRIGLSTWAWSQRAALHRHPWVVRIPINGPPTTPRQLEWLEVGLSLLKLTSMTESQKMSSILLLSGYVRNEATLVQDLQAGFMVDQEVARAAMATYAGTLRQLTDPRLFPSLHAVMDSGMFDEPDDSDAEFVFGLERVLDGIEALDVRMAT